MPRVPLNINQLKEQGGKRQHNGLRKWHTGIEGWATRGRESKNNSKKSLLGDSRALWHMTMLKMPLLIIHIPARFPAVFGDNIFQKCGALCDTQERWEQHKSTLLINSLWQWQYLQLWGDNSEQASHECSLSPSVSMTERVLLVHSDSASN